MTPSYSNRYVYMSQTFVFDFMLNDEVLPSAIFYGTIAPLILYSCTKKFLIDPYLDYQRNRDLDKKKENNRTFLQEKRREAQSVVNLWQETYARTVEKETSSNGLIILTAVYGKSSAIDELITKTPDFDSLHLDPLSEVIDVKIPIQCQVKESRLILPNVSKVRVYSCLLFCFVTLRMSSLISTHRIEKCFYYSKELLFVCFLVWLLCTDRCTGSFP
jgi:DnaJ family protein C protein 11